MFSWCFQIVTLWHLILAIFRLVWHPKKRPQEPITYVGKLEEKCYWEYTCGGLFWGVANQQENQITILHKKTLGTGTPQSRDLLVTLSKGILSTYRYLWHSRWWSAWFVVVYAVWPMLCRLVQWDPPGTSSSCLPCCCPDKGGLIGQHQPLLAVRHCNICCGRGRIVHPSNAHLRPFVSFQRNYQ